jgi:hypothetical protein
MANSDLVYCIPPYLLNTCIGSTLQSELLEFNQSLGLLNVVSLSSPNYHYGVSPPTTSENPSQSAPVHDPITSVKDPIALNKDLARTLPASVANSNGNISAVPPCFSEDFWLNEIIRHKVVYKLSVLGLLGDNPMSSEKADPEYLFDILHQFRDRFDLNSTETSEDSTGEIDFNPILFPTMPSSYHKYLSMPLNQLLSLTNFKINHKYNYPPSFITDGKKFFNYLLPISWIPLVPNKYLPLLNNNLLLDIVNNDGYASINLTTNYNAPKFDENIIKRSFNFICEKPISPSTGIFYYELEINQEVTSATDFKPIIVVNDSSVSSDSTLHVSAGFTKRNISFESSSLPSNFQSSPDRIDLKKISTDILCNEKFLVDELVNNEVEALLTTKPGEFKGSFAVNFENLTFYNSIKNNQWTQRTSSISRKNENGKLDIGTPFKTQLNQDKADKKLYKFDTVGCGLNFIDQSVFITLNGVLTKIITKDELDVANPVADKLFYDSKEKNNETSIFPIIGFDLNDCRNIKLGPPSKCSIKTNLGFKEFKFNISKYVKTFKDQNQRYLALLDKDTKICDKLSSVEITSPHLNDDDSISLNKLIKGYLNHEGYNETFKALNNDLEKLAREINPNQQQLNDDSAILEKSHAGNRQLIKNYMMNYQFDHLIKFLDINYGNVFSTTKGQKVAFNLDLLDLTYKLKQFIERKLNLTNNESEFEFTEQKPEEELYEQAFAKVTELKAKYKDNNNLETVEKLASLLLVLKKQDLEKLPVAQMLLVNFDNDVKLQLSEINRMILKSLGFKSMSNLEMIFENVSKNIRCLSLEHNDDKFMLVNFEKDHMEL